MSATRCLGSWEGGLAFVMRAIVAADRGEGLGGVETQREPGFPGSLDLCIAGIRRAHEKLRAASLRLGSQPLRGPNDA